MQINKGNCANLIEVPTEVLETMKAQSAKISQDEIIYQVKELSALEYSLKWASDKGSFGSNAYKAMR